MTASTKKTAKLGLTPEQVEILVREIDPGFKREGDELVLLNPQRQDGSRGSFKINRISQKWSDFATSKKGANAVSFWAYCKGIPNSKAAKELTQRFGAEATRSHEAPKDGLTWVPMFETGLKAFPDPPRNPSRTWTYRDQQGRPLFLRPRYDFVKDGKPDKKVTWWGAFRGLNGNLQLLEKAPPAPRPLYGLPDLQDPKRNQGVLVVEGEKSADAARILFPTMAVLTSGASDSAGTADWTPLTGRDAVLWPDHDAPGLEYAKAVTAQLQRLGVQVAVVDVPDFFPQKWDLADPLPDGVTPATLVEMLTHAQPLVVKDDDCAEVMKLLARGSHGQPLVVGANLTKIFRHHPQWAGHVGLNEMSLEVCYDRMPKPDHFVDEVQEWLQDHFGLNFTRKEIQAKLLAQASCNPFHPVREYFKSLPAWDGVERLMQVAKKILKAGDSALYITYITRWSIGAVRRVMHPGCKQDTTLVLSGPQATMKSSFFDVLGGEFFNDSPIDMNNKDGFMVLHRAWISELGEIDHATSTIAVERIKAFLSSRKDTFRAPYAVSVAVHPRTCVLVGTTNRDDYLTDPSGSRRFWTIKVTVPADLKLLRKWRDQLWAEAAAREADGIDHWLNAEDEAAREVDSEQFECVDPLESMFLDWVDRSKGVRVNGKVIDHGYDLSAGISIQQLMEKFDIPKAQQSKPTSMRLTAILKKHDWERCGRDSSRARLWSPKKSKRAARAKK